MKYNTIFSIDSIILTQLSLINDTIILVIKSSERLSVYRTLCNVYNTCIAVYMLKVITCSLKTIISIF